MNAPTPFNVRAVLFDLDGTLVDTADDLGAAVNQLRADQHLPALPLAQLRPFASHGAHRLLQEGLGVTQEDPDFPRLRDAFLQYYFEGLSVRSRLFDGAEEALARIEERGFPWGIVTNKPTKYTLPLLHNLGIGKRPRVVICGDTTEYAKPHPAPMFAAANALGCDPSLCLYIGDAERDIAAGIAAGMKTLIARYGYIADDETPSSWMADGVIHDLPSVLHWLPTRPSEHIALRLSGTRSGIEQ